MMESCRYAAGRACVLQTLTLGGRWVTALRLEYAHARRWKSLQFVCRPDRTRLKPAATVRTASTQPRLDAVTAERAFKATNHRVGRMWREILVAAFAVRPKLKHLSF